LGGTSFGGAVCLVRGGSAMWAWRNRSGIGLETSVHQPVVVAMPDAHMLQAIEVAQKRLPFRDDAGPA